MAMPDMQRIGNKAVNEILFPISYSSCSVVGNSGRKRTNSSPFYSDIIAHFYL